jgi:EVE domain
MTGHWIAVASAEHVRRGRSEGFMQVSHGKAAPLKRIKPSDRVVYYSPTITLGGKDKLQAFTAIGTVKEGEPYVFDMGNTAAMSRGQRPPKRRFIRCSTGWSSPPGSRTGVISSASGFFRSARRISI